MGWLRRLIATGLLFSLPAFRIRSLARLFALLTGLVLRLAVTSRAIARVAIPCFVRLAGAFIGRGVLTRAPRARLIGLLSAALFATARAITIRLTAGVRLSFAGCRRLLVSIGLLLRVLAAGLLRFLARLVGFLRAR